MGGSRLQLLQNLAGMLAQLGRATLNGAGRASKPYLDAGLFHAAEICVFYFHHHPGFHRVGVVQPLFDCLADGAGAAGRADGFLPLQGRAEAESFLEPLNPHVPSFQVQGLAEVGYCFCAPIGVPRRFQELVNETLVVSMILHPPTVGALVLPLHGQPGLVSRVRVFHIVELDQVTAHGGKHGIV